MSWGGLQNERWEGRLLIKMNKPKRTHPSLIYWIASNFISMLLLIGIFLWAYCSCKAPWDAFESLLRSPLITLIPAVPLFKYLPFYFYIYFLTHSLIHVFIPVAPSCSPNVFRTRCFIKVLRQSENYRASWKMRSVPQFRLFLQHDKPFILLFSLFHTLSFYSLSLSLVTFKSSPCSSVSFSNSISSNAWVKSCLHFRFRVSSDYSLMCISHRHCPIEASNYAQSQPKGDQYPSMFVRETTT